MNPPALGGVEGTVRLLLTKIHPCSFGCPLRSRAAVSWVKKKPATPAGIWRETRRATNPGLVLGRTASHPLLTVRKPAPPLCPLLIRGTRVGASTRQAIRIRAKRLLKEEFLPASQGAPARKTGLPPGRIREGTPVHGRTWRFPVLARHDDCLKNEILRKLVTV